MEGLPAPGVLRAFGYAALAIIAFTFFDVFLVRAEREQQAEAARKLYTRAQALSAAGDHDEALTLYRDALSRRPENQEYELAMVRALMNVGRIQDAESAATTLLDDYPASGPANLAMARILVQEKKPTQAAWYYHRAIYGTWHKDPGKARLEVRLELADLLARRKMRNELVAELLLIETEGPKDADTRKRIGKYYLEAESWSHADALYRTLVHENPHDVESWIGLGDAEFGLEKYARAGWAYRQAQLQGATDPRIAARIHDIDTGAVFQQEHGNQPNGEDVGQ